MVKHDLHVYLLVWSRIMNQVFRQYGYSNVENNTVTYIGIVWSTILEMIKHIRLRNSRKNGVDPNGLHWIPNSNNKSERKVFNRLFLIMWHRLTDVLNKKKNRYNVNQTEFSSLCFIPDVTRPITIYLKRKGFKN